MCDSVRLLFFFFFLRESSLKSAACCRTGLAAVTGPTDVTLAGGYEFSWIT